MEDDALISKHINSPSFILPLPALNCHAVSWVKHTSNLFIWSPRLWPTRVHRFQKFVLVVINWLFRFVLIDFSESFPLLLFSDQGLKLICSNMFWHLKQLGIEPASPHSLDNLLYLHSHLQQQKLNKILLFSPINVRNIRKNNPHQLFWVAKCTQLL